MKKGAIPPVVTVASWIWLASAIGLVALLKAAVAAFVGA